MNRLVSRCVLMFLVLGALCASALSDDGNPPPWRNLNDPNTTKQEWLFSTNPQSGQHIPADVFTNPNATPYYEVAFHGYTATPPATWYDRSGILGVYNTDPMYVTIPNTPSDPTRHKDVWIQLTWLNEGPMPTVTATNPQGTVNLVGTITLPPPPLGVYSDKWYLSTYSVSYPENPASEVIQIGCIDPGSIYLDQMVIDTRCVPEPSILAMLGIGAVGLLGYRWRRGRAVGR